jgi:hypothetical protein
MTKTIPEIDDTKDFIRDAMDKARRKMDRDAWDAFVAEVTKPPAEPEIEVTEAMMEAGRCAAIVPGMGFSHARMASIYRAMVKAAPKGAKSAPQGVSAGAPEKATGGGVSGTLHSRAGEGQAHQHRRKTDAAYRSFFSLDQN